MADAGSPAPTEQSVRRALDRVIDPELRRPVTELDMVPRVSVQGGRVAMVLPAEPSEALHVSSSAAPATLLNASAFKMGSIYTTLAAVLVMGVVSPAAPRISTRIAAASPVAIHPTVDAAIAAGSVLDHGRLLPLDALGNIVNDCDASTLQPRWAAALDAVVNEWRALPAAVPGLELVAVYARATH